MRQHRCNVVGSQSAETARVDGEAGSFEVVCINGKGVCRMALDLMYDTLFCESHWSG